MKRNQRAVVQFSPAEGADAESMAISEKIRHFIAGVTPTSALRKRGTSPLGCDIPDEGRPPLRSIVP
jgi:hypothetical protein